MPALNPPQETTPMNIPRHLGTGLRSSSSRLRQMNRNAGLRALTLLCGSLLFFGCTILSVRKIVNDFEGLDAALARSSSDNGTLRILFVHGMGHHNPGYSGPVMQGVAARLNLANVESLEKIPIAKESHDYGEIDITKYSGANGRQIEVYELTWSVTTDQIKERQFKTDLTYAGDRVSLNRKLKAELINDALADPVLYIGRYRNHMQFPIMRAIKAVLHDYHPQDEVAVITYSLGSYMCYDTLLKMSRGERIMGERDYSADVVRDLIGHTNYVFMLANQLPLLELSEVTNPISLRQTSSSALKSLAEIRRRNRPKSAVQRQEALLPLHLVAFSDPNDLLSYPLDQGSVAGNSIAYSNVVISIQRSALLGIVADPLTAHTGHERSPAVMDLLTYGNKRPSP
jgi:hypothetical protein